MHLTCWTCCYSRLRRTQRVPPNSRRKPRRRRRVDLGERLRRRFVCPIVVTLAMDFKQSCLMCTSELDITMEAKTDLMSLMRFESLSSNVATLEHRFHLVFCFVFLQKWSKGKVRDKLNNQVLFDKPTYEKLLKEVPQYKLITPSIVSERLKIRGSLARRALIELQQKGLIKQVVQHHAQLIYTRTTKGDDPAV